MFLNFIYATMPEDTSTSGMARMSFIPPPTQSLGPSAGAPPRDAAQPSWNDQPTSGEYLDTWVTIFGFSQSDTPLILKVRRSSSRWHANMNLRYVFLDGGLSPCGAPHL